MSVSVKRKWIYLSQRTLTSFPRGQRKAKNQKPLEMFDTTSTNFQEEKEHTFKRKTWEGRLTKSHETHPAKDVLDKLPRIVGERDWGIKWLQKLSLMNS